MTLRIAPEPGSPGGLEETLAAAAELRCPDGRLTIAALACLATGLLATTAGLLLIPSATWGALIVNFLFWIGLAQGGAAFAATLILAGARWGRVIHRIAAGLMAFLPVALFLLPLLWFGRGYLFPWLDQQRHPWHHPGWLLLRDWVALAAMTLLCLAFLYYSVRPDLGQAPHRGNVQAWITRGWRGLQEERRRCHAVRWHLAAAVAALFVLQYALLAIDLGLSVQHGFYSTLFPVIYLVGSFYAALAVTAILAAAWRRLDRVQEIIAPGHLLDLGNLLWSFSLFLGYLWWTQYLIVWMANLPEEAEHHLLRWWTWPWNALSWTAAAAGFGVPFLLLFSRTIKRHPLALAGVAATAVMGVLLNRFQDLFPALKVTPGDLTVLISAGVTVGFLGAAALPYLWLMRRIPIFPVEDAQFAEALRLRGIRL